VIDSRITAPGDLYVAIRGEHHDGHDFCAQAIAAGARAVMVERGRGAPGATVIEVDDTRVALGELAREHRRAWAAANPDARLVAITGSAGKTTTKDLTRAALSHVAATHAATGSLNNETGVPLTLLGLRAHHRFAVVEMGMRGKGQIAYLVGFAEPDVAAVVNAGTAHIELLGSTDAIAEAKSEIYAGAKVTVAPADDPRLHGAITFGEAAGATVRLAGYRATGPDGSEIALEIDGRTHTLHLPLIGRHNAIDAACAVACAIGAGAPVEQALAGVARARPAHMRSEVVDIGGRHVIVDCYNANPASMSAALHTLAELAHDRRGIAVVGDMLELGDHAETAHRDVGQLAAELGLPVVSIGRWKDVVRDATGQPALAWATDDPADAARQALAATEPGDWILVKASRGMRLERVVDAMKEVAV
jgi:UDP-N-acetylmuramoyl-tripeptide--D-alanyl-D-alanine ligase